VFPDTFVAGAAHPERYGIKLAPRYYWRQKMKHLLITYLLLAISQVAAAGGKEVNLDNYVEAMSDIYFGKIVDKVGTNKIFHDRSTKTVETQLIIRENRDTLYSNAVVDARKGVQIVLPPSKVYMSVLVLDYRTHLIRDSNSDDVGTFQAYSEKERVIKITPEAANTDYIYLVFRTQSDGSQKGDRYANQLQDKIRLTAASNVPWKPQGFDEKQRDAITKTYVPRLAEVVAQGTQYGYNEKGKVTRDHQNFYAAIGWGGQLEKYATYGTTPDITSYGSKCAITTIDPPEVDYDRGGFWSYQVYGLDGFIHSNNSTLNNDNTVLNKNGTVTLRFGSREACGTDENRADKNDDGFSVTTRIYNPVKPVPLEKRALSLE
jgi:hypothetical protein